MAKVPTKMEVSVEWKIIPCVKEHIWENLTHGDIGYVLRFEAIVVFACIFKKKQYEINIKIIIIMWYK